MNLGKKCEDYLFELAAITEVGPGLTRLYLSKEHTEAIELIRKWMEQAGLETVVDPAGNVVGSYDCGDQNKPTLMLGSHQDSVIHGGLYDGMLGVIAPIVALEEIGIENVDFNLKVLAFGDEEGVRFGTAYLGSKALTGSFTEELMQLEDESGITVRKALTEFGLDPDQIEQAKMPPIPLDYLEVHIEQGPVLEAEDQAVGIVEGINSFRRYELEVQGHAGHAGNLPMNNRQDAGVVMAQIMTDIKDIAIETASLVATVGKIQIHPNAINVVPGKAVFSLDIRAPEDEVIDQAMEEIIEKARKVSKHHQTRFTCKELTRGAGCQCDPAMMDLVQQGIEEEGIEPVFLFSGAGHDAQEMSKIANIGMLFVRCKDGVSHHPDEYVAVEDLEQALWVLIAIIKKYNRKGT